MDLVQQKIARSEVLNSTEYYTGASTVYNSVLGNSDFQVQMGCRITFNCLPRDNRCKIAVS